MSVIVKHPFVSTVPDDADTSLVRPSNWNADHTITGLGTAAELNAGVANGVATLDAGGKVPVSELPAAVLGALSYQGTWNASTNTPTLTSSTGTKGYYYVVSVAGNTNLDGITDWLVGDWAVYNGTVWQKVDNTESVSSVNGQTGAVVLNAASVGAVSSVGLTSSAASLAITNSPITSSGNIGVNFAGLSNQYVRGDGALANFPTTQGGGSSVSYYLNGSVNQGTFGGNTYYEMSKTPIFGAGTNFSVSANGYIAQFITDAGDPALLSIPAGNWNFELFFSASSGGGSPSFYIELYKYDGTTFTLIASDSGSPEGITNGTTKDLYFSAIAVPQTALTLTDRLAVRVYVTTSGRTITLHTEDNNLCQIITTFSTGINALNGLTAQVQYLATGTSGTDFNISSLTDTHTFNIPSSSATNRGLLTSSDWTTFNNKVTSVSGTTGRITSSGGTTPAIDLASGIVTAGTTGSSTLIPVITVDTYGRVTAVTTAANPQGTVTSITAGTGLTGGTITTSGTIAIDSTVVVTSGSYANPSWITSLDGSKITGTMDGGSF